jgi:hypothetical protein
MKNIKTKSSKSDFLNRIPQLRISKFVAKLVIVILTFSNLGVYFIASSSALETYRVRYIVFCTVDTYCPGVQSWYNTGLEVKKWYFLRSGVGRTYTMAPPVIVVGNLKSTEYSKGSSWSAAQNTYNKVFWELLAKGYIDSATKGVVMFPFKTMEHCGATGGQLALVDPNSNSWCSPNLYSLTAHELGHSLGFNHVSDGTLMHSPEACNSKAFWDCVLNSNHRSMLQNSPYLNSTTK